MFNNKRPNYLRFFTFIQEMLLNAPFEYKKKLFPKTTSDDELNSHIQQIARSHKVKYIKEHEKNSSMVEPLSEEDRELLNQAMQEIN